MRRGSALALALLILASCDRDSTSSPTTERVATTTTPAPTTAAATSSTTTSAATTPTSTTTTTSTTISTTATTTTPTVPEPECDRGAATAILDLTADLARLAEGGVWSDDTAGVAFDGRTRTADEFADSTAFDCALRLVQTTTDGAERLALVAWNERRHAAVIQATDPPLVPYSPDAAFQLFVEQPRGEFLVDRFVWAGTMAGGESIVVATDDYSAAITAKSWQVQAPEFEDLPVMVDAERYAIDTLRAVGARNVAIAEPTHSPIASIMFDTPLALGAIATVGPVADFDPMVPITTDGETTIHQVGGVDVRVTSGTELGGELFEAGFACGDHGWRLEAILGSPAELLEFAELLITSTDC